MLIAALAAALSTPPPDSPLAKVESSKWLRTPTSEQFADAYPLKESRTGIEGAVILRCFVSPDGRMERCKTAFEAPSEHGFGEAAMKLAPDFQMSVVGARTTEQPVVTIPIRFRMHGATQPTDVALVPTPIWTKAPSFSDMAASDRQMAGGETGYATTRCSVDSLGRLGFCTAQPGANASLARAALFLSEQFTVKFEPSEFASGKAFLVDTKIHFIDPNGDDFKDRRLVSPDWLIGLDPPTLKALFPTAATIKGVTKGRGMAECTVGSDGALGECQGVSGEPDGLGFAEAAVKAASSMRMNLWTLDGGPVEGARVRIPVVFDNSSAQPTVGSTPPSK